MSKFQRARFHAGLRAEARYNLARQFPKANIDALERSIMGPIQCHEVGFATLRGVLGTLTKSQTQAWYKRHKAKAGLIFDNLPTEDPNYGKKHRDASARWFIENAGVPPLGLGFETVESVAAMLRYERYGPVGIVFSEGWPNPWGQRGHCDHDPRIDTFEGFFDRTHKKKPVLSMIAPLSGEGMWLDIWGTEKWYRVNGRPLPLHPHDRPLFRVYLGPGDAILFRYDLIHAGCGYTKPNYRVFCTFRAYTGQEEWETNTTWQMTCECVHLLQKELWKQGKELKTACQCPQNQRDDPEAACTCGAHACSCPKRTQEAEMKYSIWRQLALKRAVADPEVDLRKGKGAKRGPEA